MDFSQYTVPGATIAFMCVSLLISIGVPIALMIVWRIRTKAKISSFFWGVGTFVVFALILESILHNIVLKAIGADAFTKLPFYAIYGGLAAGAFEEFGRYIVMKLFMKKDLTKKESIMFGIGHGGAESILLVGLTYISNLVIAVLLNAGQGNLLTLGMNSDLQMQLFDQLSPLWLYDSYIFLAAGIERMFAITFHICASYLVYRSIRDRKFALCLLAVFLHALMDGVTVTIQKLTGSTVLTEAFVAVFVILFAVFTVTVYRKEREEAVETAESAPVSEEA